MIALNKIAAASLFYLVAAAAIAASPPTMLNDPVDISGDFRAMENFYYLADQLAEFDPATHTGKIVYQRAQFAVRHAFDNDLAIVIAAKPNEFPRKPIRRQSRRCRSPLILFRPAPSASA